jgi:phosphoribosyl 1,2-cyclic phosphodiesterase
MELIVLGSSSKGNGYILKSDNGECLLIEAGVPLKDVKKALDFNISGIVGCLVSHEHGDHAKYVQKYIDARIVVCMSDGTAGALKLSRNHWNNEIIAGASFNISKYKVIAFSIEHDAAEPFGFLIQHPEMGTTLFATDTYYLANTFKGLNNIMIECNYRLDILEENIKAGNIHPAQRDRVLQSHMSYDTCVSTLLANDLSAVNNIVLIHLSEGNSNAEEFRNGITEATGKTVHIAEKGMSLNFTKTPF